MLKLCALSCNGRRRVGVQPHLGPVAQVLKIKMWLVNSSSKISYFLLPSRKSANALLGIYWHFKKIKPLIFTFRAKCVSRLFSLQFQNILAIRKVTQFQIYQNMWIISILTYDTSLNLLIVSDFLKSKFATQRAIKFFQAKIWGNPFRQQILIRSVIPVFGIRHTTFRRVPDWKGRPQISLNLWFCGPLRKKGSLYIGAATPSEISYWTFCWRRVSQSPLPFFVR